MFLMACLTISVIAEYCSDNMSTGTLLVALHLLYLKTKGTVILYGLLLMATEKHNRIGYLSRIRRCHDGV